jgi:hypothetical protein
MAALIPTGSVIDPRKDIFPTTGAHLDVRVIPQFGTQKGKKIDPKTAKTLLQNVLIGKEKTPLVQQQGQEWKWNFPITSEYGKRAAPTAGASTFHEGIDVSLGAGTPLAYKGYGTYRPDRGFGSLMTTDPQGNPYEIRFLHTEPGGKAAIGSTDIPTAPTLPSAKTPDQTTDQLVEQLIGKQPTMKDVLVSRALGQALERRQEMESLINLPQAGFITPQQAMQMFA